MCCLGDLLWEKKTQKKLEKYTFQHLEFLLKRVVGRCLCLHLVYGYLNLPQQLVHLSFVGFDVQQL